VPPVPPTPPPGSAPDLVHAEYVIATGYILNSNQAEGCRAAVVYIELV